MERNIRKIFAWMLIIVLIISNTGCSSQGENYNSITGDAIDQASNLVQMEDENVIMVKKGCPESFPGITYEDAFGDFFSNPTWKYFKGTSKGPDDDGDGNPDFTSENIDVVEFTGRCSYMDVDVKALIQFVLDKKNGTFEAYCLSLNDIPQNGLMLVSLIEKAFTQYAEKHNIVTDEAQAETDDTLYEDDSRLSTTQEETFSIDDSDSACISPISYNMIADDVVNKFNEDMTVYTFEDDNIGYKYDYQNRRYYVSSYAADSETYSPANLIGTWVYEKIQDNYGSIPSKCSEAVDYLFSIYGNILNPDYMSMNNLEKFVCIYEVYFWLKESSDYLSDDELEKYDEIYNTARDLITEMHNVIRVTNDTVPNNTDIQINAEQLLKYSGYYQGALYAIGLSPYSSPEIGSDEVATVDVTDLTTGIQNSFAAYYNLDAELIGINGHALYYYSDEHKRIDLIVATSQSGEEQYIEYYSGNEMIDLLDYQYGFNGG